MEAYRNGYNGIDLKSIMSASIRPEGSNPSASAIYPVSLVYRTLVYGTRNGS